MARRAPWGARKRRRSGWANDTRLAPSACSEPPKRARMGTGPAQRQSCGPGGHVPHMHRILQGEIRWRPPKWGSRVRAPLVPDGAAPRTQQGHPSAMEAVGARNATFHHEGCCLPPLARKPHGPRSARARAEGPGRVWVGPLSGQGVSNAYQPPRNAISAFWSPPPNLLLEDSVAGGATPPWAPRRGRRSPGIHSRLVRAVFVPI